LIPTIYQLSALVKFSAHRLADWLEVFGFRLDELVSVGNQRSAGKIGECKNVAAYRTVHLGDPEGQKEMETLKRFLDHAASPNALVFRSKRNGPLLETTILNQGLHPALKSLDLKQAGLHAFRTGCNRRWELAGIVPAVIRQQMGHTTAAMTSLYAGEIPIEQVKVESSMKNRLSVVQLEKMENEAAV
jgi:integrase